MIAVVLIVELKKAVTNPQTDEKPPSEQFRKWQILAGKATVHYIKRPN